MTRTRVTLLPVGDPNRVTGGYLFHRRLAERAPRHRAEVTFVSIPDMPLPWAIAAGPGWLRAPATRTADVLVLDSLAASAAAPWLGHVAPPVVGMLHQPLGGMDAHRLVRSFRAPFDRRAYRTRREGIAIIAPSAPNRIEPRHRTSWLPQAVSNDEIAMQRSSDPEDRSCASRCVGRQPLLCSLQLYEARMAQPRSRVPIEPRSIPPVA